MCIRDRNIAPRIQSFTCPCCGGHIGEAAPIQAVIDAERSWVSRAILEALSKPVGRRVRRDSIIQAIYQLADEPENSRETFAVTLSGLRKRLMAFGWMIRREGSRGPQGDGGAVYRLIPTEAGQ